MRVVLSHLQWWRFWKKKQKTKHLRHFDLTKESGNELHAGHFTQPELFSQRIHLSTEKHTYAQVRVNIDVSFELRAATRNTALYTYRIHIAVMEKHCRCVLCVFCFRGFFWSSRKFSQTYIRCIVTSSHSPKERKNKQNNNPLHPLPPTRPPRIVGMYVCICVVRDFPSSLRHLLERARHRTLLPVQGYTLLSCCRHRRCFLKVSSSCLTHERSLHARFRCVSFHL